MKAVSNRWLAITFHIRGGDTTAITYGAGTYIVRFISLELAWSASLLTFRMHS